MSCKRTVLIGLAIFAACGACSSDPSSDLTDPTVPETWVAPQMVQRGPWFWSVLADVREFVGEKRWGSLDTAWMAEKALADHAKYGLNSPHFREDMYSGLWRLGLLREEVVEAFVKHDGPASWPLDTPRSRSYIAWRPRVERWRQERASDVSDEALGEKLRASWRLAVAAEDPKTAARIVETCDAWLGVGMGNSFRSDAEMIVRASIGSMKRGNLPGGVIYLLERFGVPEGIDLGPVLRAVQGRYERLADEPVLLVWMHNLHLRCLRLARLR